MPSNTTSILDEILADQVKPTQCAFCNWLADQPLDQRKQWHEAATSKTFHKANVYKAAAKRFPKDADGNVLRLFGPSSMESHSKNGHAMPTDS